MARRNHDQPVPTLARKHTETVPAVAGLTEALSWQTASLTELLQAIRASEAEARANQTTHLQVLKAVETAVHRLHG